MRQVEQSNGVRYFACVLGVLATLILMGCCGGNSGNAASAPLAYKATSSCFTPANFRESSMQNTDYSLELCEYSVEKDEHYARTCFASRNPNWQSATTFSVPCADFDAIKKITGN
ncbi:MAG: hypothetical protein NTX72_01185 [Candidatus Uhrbacteria bacterium]|nr:hypothetical protein [Candidatus Uhrbacteria bacterium]